MFELFHKTKASSILATTDMISLVKDPIPYYYQQKFLLSVGDRNCSYNSISQELINNFKQYFLFNSIEDFNHEDNLWRSQLLTSPNLHHLLSATFLSNNDFALYHQFQQILYFQLRVLKIFNLGNSFSFDLNTHMSLNSHLFNQLDNNYFSNKSLTKSSKNTLSYKISSSIFNITKPLFNSFLKNLNASSDIQKNEKEPLHSDKKLQNLSDFHNFCAFLKKDSIKIFYNHNFNAGAEQFQEGANRYIKDYVNYFLKNFSQKSINNFDSTLKKINELDYSDTFEEMFFDMMTMIPSQTYTLDLNSYLLTVMEPTSEQKNLFEFLSYISFQRLSFNKGDSVDYLNIVSPFYSTMQDIYGPLDEDQLLTKIHECTKEFVTILSDKKFEKFCNFSQSMHEHSLLSILDDMSHGKIKHITRKKKI